MAIRVRRHVVNPTKRAACLADQGRVLLRAGDARGASELFARAAALEVGLRLTLVYQRMADRCGRVHALSLLGPAREVA